MAGLATHCSQLHVQLWMTQCIAICAISIQLIYSQQSLAVLHMQVSVSMTCMLAGLTSYTIVIDISSQFTKTKFNMSPIQLQLRSYTYIARYMQQQTCMHAQTACSQHAERRSVTCIASQLAKDQITELFVSIYSYSMHGATQLYLYIRMRVHACSHAAAL